MLGTADTSPLGHGPMDSSRPRDYAYPLDQAASLQNYSGRDMSMMSSADDYAVLAGQMSDYIIWNSQEIAPWPSFGDS